MWIYEKKLEFPVKITKPDARLAKIMIEQYGGADGELGASLRYLSQKFTMVTPEAKATLNDIATEEFAHLEMMGTIVHQLTRDMTMEEIEKAGFQAYFVDHTAGVYPQAAAGFPFDALCLASKGDAITDLSENMAAEQKARKTYDNILTLVKESDVREPIKFLRAREIVHFQRFGEALRMVTEDMDKKNFYAFNPSSCIK